MFGNSTQNLRNILLGDIVHCFSTLKTFCGKDQENVNKLCLIALHTCFSNTFSLCHSCVPFPSTFSRNLKIGFPWKLIHIPYPETVTLVTYIFILMLVFVSFIYGEIKPNGVYIVVSSVKKEVSVATYLMSTQ